MPLLRNCALALCAANAFVIAQIASNSVSVTATRSVTAPADQAVFSISLRTPLTAALDNVLTALSGTGLSASNLTGVSGDSSGLLWTFSLVVPLSKAQDTIAVLAKLQNDQRSGGSNLSYFVDTQTSAEGAAARPCPYADLAADAAMRAQAIANSAGVGLGTLVAASDSTSPQGLSFVRFFAITAVAGFVSFVNSPSAAPCALTATFGSAAESHSITVTASHNSASAPLDQVLFSVNVTTGIYASLGDVLEMLAGTGITAANLGAAAGLSLPNPLPVPSSAPHIHWPFTFQAPFSKLSDAIALLVALQQKLGSQNGNPVMSFYVQGLSSSTVPACNPADVLNDAHTRAQQIADATRLGLGPVLSISTGVSDSTAAAVLPVVAQTDPGCTATVKFGTLR